MIFGLFRRRGDNEAIVLRLYEHIAAAARRPAFYAELGVPDTVEGRFEMLTLHAHLVVRRLRALPDPAGHLAQDLVDTIFAHFDAALRELGVGDISVPKRMKTMASAFLGRSKAYEQALAGETGVEDLETVIRRNVFNDPTGHGPQAVALASYVRRALAALGAEPFEAFVEGRVPFPEPREVARDPAEVRP